MSRSGRALKLYGEMGERERRQGFKGYGADAVWYTHAADTVKTYPQQLSTWVCITKTKNPTVFLTEFLS